MGPARLTLQGRRAGECREPISNAPPDTMPFCNPIFSKLISRFDSHSRAGRRPDFSWRPKNGQVDFKIFLGRRVFGLLFHHAHCAAFSREVRRTSALSSAPLAILLTLRPCSPAMSMRSAGRSLFPALCPAVPADAVCLLTYLTGQNQRELRAGSSSSEQSGAQATSALSADAGAAVRSADGARLALGASTSAVSL